MKHKLIDQAIVVTIKGGGSGAEGYLTVKTSPADPYKVIFGANNAYLPPYVAKLGYETSDLQPVAALAFDEFLLWVKADAPCKSAKDYIAAVKAKPETFKMGGSQSKDTDQTLTSMISAATGAKFIYVPFLGGAAAGSQLAGGHVDSNVNNPNESIGQWKAGRVRPLDDDDDAGARVHVRIGQNPRRQFRRDDGRAAEHMRDAGSRVHFAPPGATALLLVVALGVGA